MSTNPRGWAAPPARVVRGDGGAPYVRQGTRRSQMSQPPSYSQPARPAGRPAQSPQHWKHAYDVLKRVAPDIMQSPAASASDGAPDAPDAPDAPGASALHELVTAWEGVAHDAQRWSQGRFMRHASLADRCSAITQRQGRGPYVASTLAATVLLGVLLAVAAVGGK